MSGAELENQDAWYAYSGSDNDVVLSSRVRLSRNLANFPFPARLRANDGERIQSIVVDAFNKMDDSDDYQALRVKSLDSLGSKILSERGILEIADKENGKIGDKGVVVRKDGIVSCTVNVIDHLRISSFAPGLDFDKSIERIRNIDVSLQKSVQFAASYEYGFLTASVLDAGSGMKLSMRVHLPSLSCLGKIPSTIEELKKSGLDCVASYGAGGLGSSLGYYYDICTADCQTGSEYDQIASILSFGKRLSDMERSARDECKKSMLSSVKNTMYRSLALARNSIFLTSREAIEIVSGVKWGFDMNLITGTSDEELYALLFRMQDGHLEYVLNNNSFNFESDVVGNTVKEKERLRALIFQEAFENVQKIN